MLAPTAKGNRDAQTAKECQDWLISEYDLEVKKLKRELDEALEELRRMGHENEMLWRYRLCQEQKGWGENG